MITIDLKDITPLQTQNYLQGVIGPRPIAFVSSVNAQGNVNLSPFSFFNMFSTNPPILVFSPSRRVRDNTTKHTFENILEVGEVVINMVNYAIVQQTSLASSEYPRGVDEFVKSGLTPVASVKVRPPRVQESPAALECKVIQVVPLGKEGGAGNLVICEVLLAHFKEEIFDSEGKIDPHKIDLVARMGGDWYCRAAGEALFKVPKPLTTTGIGVDQLPLPIRQSNVLTGNDLARLANVASLPELSRLAMEENRMLDLFQRGEEEVHRHVQQLLQKEKTEEAWTTLLSFYNQKEKNEIN